MWKRIDFQPSAFNLEQKCVMSEVCVGDDAGVAAVLIMLRSIVMEKEKLGIRLCENGKEVIYVEVDHP